MKLFSTSQAAKKIGMHRVNLQNAIKQRTIPAPKLAQIGSVSVRLWTSSEIERARKAMKKARKRMD
jgi:predicted DNA-binding transcriptional regulator AlpA